MLLGFFIVTYVCKNKMLIKNITWGRQTLLDLSVYYYYELKLNSLGTFFELLFFERKMCIINTKKYGKIITLLSTRLSDYKILQKTWHGRRKGQHCMKAKCKLARQIRKGKKGREEKKAKKTKRAWWVEAKLAKNERRDQHDEQLASK